jgi:NAD(P)-dependent dehydrogenase (short-subunit alcohol dehydrogenase family)
MPSYAITGASRGLGRELVRQLSAQPDTVVFALVRTPSKATALSQLATERPGRIHILPADVTDPQSLVAAAEAVGAVTGGTLDVLIHNAFEMDPAVAALPPSHLPLDWEALDGLFRASWGTDVYGTVWVTNAFLPLVEKGAEKKVVHISTGMADLDVIRTTGIATAVPYAVSKAGLNVLSAKYAAEFAEKGVKFLALSPGWVDTFEGPRKSTPFTSPHQSLSRILISGNSIAPPEMQPFFEMLLSHFRRVEPSLTGRLTMEDSVKMQLEVISGLDEKLSGSFVSHHGNRNWF